MSTSTALSIRKTQGRCVVCGKDTTKKCGSCSAAGIEWMYFCSPEHQKEVWSIHKRVCGSNPFVWPLLSEKEVKEIVSLFHVPAKSVDGPTTWRDQFKIELGSTYARILRGKSEEEEKQILESKFKEVVESYAQPSANQRKHQKGLVDIRAMAFSIKACSKDPLTGNITTGQRHQLLAEDPFGFLAWMEHKTIHYMSSSYSAPWWSTMQHRLVLFVTALVNHHKENEWNISAKIWVTEPDSFRAHALREAAYFSEEIISQTHLTEANAITGRLLGGIEAEIGSGQSCDCKRECTGCGRVKPLFDSSPY